MAKVFRCDRARFLPCHFQCVYCLLVLKCEYIEFLSSNVIIIVWFLMSYVNIWDLIGIKLTWTFTMITFLCLIDKFFILTFNYIIIVKLSLNYRILIVLCKQISLAILHRCSLYLHLSHVCFMLILLIENLIVFFYTLFFDIT